MGHRDVYKAATGAGFVPIGIAGEPTPFAAFERRILISARSPLSHYAVASTFLLFINSANSIFIALAFFAFSKAYLAASFGSMPF
jgi:hypothetical protein